MTEVIQAEDGTKTKRLSGPVLTGQLQFEETTSKVSRAYSHNVMTNKKDKKKRVEAEFLEGFLTEIYGRRNQVINDLEAAKQSAPEKIHEIFERIGVNPDDRQSMLDELLQEIFGFGFLDGFIKDPSLFLIAVASTGRAYINKEKGTEVLNLKLESPLTLDFLFDRLAQNSEMMFDEGFPFARFEHPKGFHVLALRFPLIEEGTMLIIEKPGYLQSMRARWDRT